MNCACGRLCGFISSRAKTITPLRTLVQLIERSGGFCYFFRHVGSREKVTAALRFTACAIFSVLLLGLATSSFAGILENQLLEKAQPDECFVAIGSSDNQFPATLPCSDPAATPKVNQAYVWGLAESNSQLWFGTVANTQCLVIAAYLGYTTPFETPSYVCEFDASQFHGTDWRPPEIFSYDLGSKTLTAKSSAAPLLAATLGIRSAGALGNVVILAGPALPPQVGVNLFAFDSNTGNSLGSTTLPDYTDIRQWVVYGDTLYTGVQYKDGTRILRWTGTPDNYFSFQEVGTLDAEAAYLVAHGDRLYATTWGGVLTGGKSPSGLWMGPQIPQSGLTPANVDDWQEVWQVNDYEPDSVTASTLVGGALASYQGQLYWGLMQVPITGALAHYAAYPDAPHATLDVILSIIGTTRPIPIFRCCGQASGGKTELLYGSTVLPVYDENTQSWKVQSNNMHMAPRFGPAGFGNPFNTYTWSMATYQGRLYVGTFKWSYLLVDGLSVFASALGLSGSDLLSGPPQIGGFSNFLNGSTLNSGQRQFGFFGADLWRFDRSDRPAAAESVDGLGNYLNYGIRTMLSDTDNLYVGTANPMNLKTVPGQPDGGWELRMLSGNSGEQP
jgi:hypothetical protein